MNKWNEYELGEVSEIHNGSTPSTKVGEYWNGDIVWITPKDLSDQNKKYIENGERFITKQGLSKVKSSLLPVGTVLLSSRAPIGLLSIAKNELVTNQGFKNIIVDEKKVNNEYLYYLLKLKKNELNNLGTGTTFRELSKSALEKYKLKLPPLSTQQKIASVLSALDDKIELNNKINAELEQMAKTLYDYWFVQFDFPNEEGKPYKSSGGKMVYNNVLKRGIPEGWDSTNVGMLANLIRGVSYDKEQIKSVSSGNSIRILRATNIIGNVIDLNEPVLVPKDLVGKQQLLNKYDILLTMSSGSINHIGKNGFYYFEDKVSFGAFCAKLVPLEKFRFYLFLFMQSNFLNAMIRNECLGTNINNLNSKIVNGFKLPKPDQDLLSKFNSIVEPLFKKIENNTKENQELAQLRDWLLPMLMMNGQVKVGDGYNIDSDAILIAAEPDVCYGDTEHLDIPSNRKGFARQVLAGKVVSVFKDDPNFSNIKFQKIQFLAEHIIEADLNQNYYYQAAGPYDNAFMKSIYGHFKTQKWFDSQNQRFVPLTKEEKIEGYYQGYFAPAQVRLDRLFNLLYQTTEAEAEIIATIYAVWNNRIIQGTSISDNELIDDFYKWSDRKQQYTKDQILVGLKWLRDNNLEPKGFGKLIKKAKGK